MGERPGERFFGIGNQAARGNYGPRPKKHKAYSEAVHDLLMAPFKSMPEAWPKDRKEWTNAQELAERHLALAMSGDMETAKQMIERAEGRVPMAPEDREAAGLDAAANLIGGLTAIHALQVALGLKRADEVAAVDTVLLEEAPATDPD